MLLSWQKRSAFAFAREPESIHPVKLSSVSLATAVKRDSESLVVSYRRMELFLQGTFNWKTLPQITARQRGPCDLETLES
jgi:hypothetical protein